MRTSSAGVATNSFILTSTGILQVRVNILDGGNHKMMAQLGKLMSPNSYNAVQTMSVDVINGVGVVTLAPTGEGVYAVFLSSMDPAVLDGFAVVDFTSQP